MKTQLAEMLRDYVGEDDLGVLDDVEDLFLSRLSETIEDITRNCNVSRYDGDDHLDGQDVIEMIKGEFKLK